MKSLPESVSILLDNCFQNNNMYWSKLTSPTKDGRIFCAFYCDNLEEDTSPRMEGSSQGCITYVYHEETTDNPQKRNALFFKKKGVL